MITKIFLSYARGDDESFVSRLYEGLTNARGPDGLLFDVWLDCVSMPARSLTFYQEIRDTINERDRLILVVGPKAIASDYVTQEWQFAYFEADKCVNPIVRLDGRDANGNRVDGYSLIPEDLKVLHAEDFREDAQFDVHLANLIRQLSEALPPVGKLVGVPELPPHYRAQPERIKALRDLLLPDLQKTVVVTGAAARVGLQGMGGIGKSVLANGLAHHPQVRRVFQDGIYWVTLGQQPRIENLQRQLAVELGGDGLFSNRHTGKEKLRQLLADRAALLILDDVWERDHADAFNVAGARSRILLTTRDAGLVTALAAYENHYRVELPTAAEAEAILSGAADVSPETLPTEAHEIIDQCGRLPLALALCGGMVLGGSLWRSVLNALRDHDLEFLSSEHSDEAQHQNVWKAMDISLRVLPKEEQERFAELAVFGKNTDTPDTAVATLWQHTAGLAPRNTEALLAKFSRRSLMQRPTAFNETTAAHIDLHDLLRHFAIGMAVKKFGSLPNLHRRLLDAYRTKSVDGWPSGPDDGYFFQNLCVHLLAAGETDEAVTLLTHLPWMEAKCKVALVFDLQNDYREVISTLAEAQAELAEERGRQERAAKWTREIVEYARQWNERHDRIARSGIVTEPEPTLPEIIPSVELWSNERIEDENQRIIEHPTRMDLLYIFRGFVETECYSLLEHGKRPGFVVQHAYNSTPAGPVHHEAVRLRSKIHGTLLVRRWPAYSTYNPRPALLRTMTGHSGEVICLSVTPDGRRSLSGSHDGTVRVWDLTSGQCIGTLEGHSGWVTSVNATPDFTLALTSSHDETLRSWDMSSRNCLRVLKGHSGWVTSASITPDGRLAVSGGWDKTLRVWDLNDGRCVGVLQGHTDNILSVCMTLDGRVAISGGWDRHLRVWDLESRRCAFLLEGHSDWINCVCVTPDGRYAVSASKDETLRVWDLRSQKCIRLFEDEEDVLVLNGIVQSRGGLTSVSITADGRLISSGGWDYKIRTRDINTENVRILEGHTRIVEAVCSTPDGRLTVSGGYDNAVRVWDSLKRRSIGLLQQHNGIVQSVCFTPDGKCALSAGGDKQIRIWDVDSLRCLGVLEGHADSVYSICVTPDGRTAVSGSWDRTIRMWDLRDKRCAQILKRPNDWRNSIHSVSLTPDGLTAISSSYENCLRVWRLNDGQCIRTLEGHVDWVQEVVVMHDGRHALSAGSGKDKTIRLWDLEKGRCLCTLGMDDEWVSSIAVTPDGKQVIAGAKGRNDLGSSSSRNVVRMWDLQEGKCICVFEGHRESVGAITVTPDGRFAVTGSWDGTLRVWSLENGQCVAVLQNSSPICSVAISKNGNTLMAGTWTGTVLFIDICGLISRVLPGEQNIEHQNKI